jgi:hypothetical protein
MNNFSRRSLLKKMARMSMLAATAPWISTITGCREDYGRCITLNVVLHGLFVLNFTDKNIELLTPSVRDHVYRASSWRVKSFLDLKHTNKYELHGVECEQTAPLVDPEYNIAPPESSYKLRRECSVFTMCLPFPRMISLIRRVPGEKNQLCGNVFQIRQLSLCQVLTYFVPDHRKLALSNTCWMPDIDPATQAANLHLWAEPPLRLSRDHACHAYGKLSEMLGLDLQLLVNNTVPLDSVFPVYGLPPEQEQGLSEWPRKL